jgi:hypothetical protein
LITTFSTVFLITKFLVLLLNHPLIQTLHCFAGTALCLCVAPFAFQFRLELSSGALSGLRFLVVFGTCRKCCASCTDFSTLRLEVLLSSLQVPPCLSDFSTVRMQGCLLASQAAALLA